VVQIDQKNRGPFGPQLAIFMSDKLSLLCDEYEICKSLTGGKGIPKAHWFRRESEYRVIVFKVFSLSLKDLFNYCGRRFSLKTELMLADQIIVRLQ
jgi:serine/threonine protein kinase